MDDVPTIVKRNAIILLIAGILIAAGIWFRGPLADFYHILSDRQAVNNYVKSWGAFAPLVFIVIQILQVIIAPIPGEVSGFAGGYLFGGVKGFIYSSIGLAVGSAINFWIGRLLGFRFVHRLIPAEKLKKLDMFISHQGIIVLAVLFIFPGFPKDYLCLFLGLTELPFKIFIILAAVGRMPGTLMLSVQGQLLYTQNYWMYAALLLVCCIIVLLAVKYKESIYRWAERETIKQRLK